MEDPGALDDLVENLKKLVDSTDKSLKDNDKSVPGGFPSFLRKSFDRATKVAIPVIVVGVSMGSMVAGIGVAAPIVGIAAHSLGLGTTMLKTYKDSKKKPVELKTDSKPTLDERFAELDAKHDTFASEVAEMGSLLISTGNNIERKIDTVLQRLDDLEAVMKRILDKDDQYIETAFEELEKRLSRGNYSAAQEFLSHLNFDDMYIKSNAIPSKARTKIQHALRKESVEAATNEYQRLLIIRNKLETMRRVEHFLNDIETNETTSMNDYCESSGEMFLEEMDEYFDIMRDLLTSQEKWKVPSVLILGKTGTGKSTLCNILAGNSPDQDYASGGFPVSDNVDSCTKETTFGDYSYAGDLKRPVTIIDTPGFDDPTKNQDAEIIANLVETLTQNFGGIHQILIAVNGTNPRLDGSMKAMISLFQGMFTERIWGHIGIVFTKIRMDKKEVRRREKQGKDYDQHFAREYVEGLKNTFNYRGDRQLDTFYIDSHYDNEDDDECEAFNAAIENLWSSIKAKEIFSTDYVSKVLTEYDSLKEELEQRDKYIEQQNLMLKESVKREEQLSIRKHEESRRSTPGFTFLELKGIPFKWLTDWELIDTNGSVWDYKKLVRQLINFHGSNAFGEFGEFEEKDYMMNEIVKNNPVEMGLAISSISSSDICKRSPHKLSTLAPLPEEYTSPLIDRVHTSLIFVLEIENRTKYFMSGVNFYGGHLFDTALLFSDTDKFSIKLREFNTFIVPPFTKERLVFTRRKMMPHRLRGVLTFSLCSPASEEEIKKIMIMFHVAGKGKNSYAIGFPNADLSENDARNILETFESEGECFSKDFHSENLKESMQVHSVVNFPPPETSEEKDFQISFRCGNSKRCLGFVTLTGSG